MAKPKSTITEYRNYFLPLHFPVLLLSGDFWKISDIPSGRQHFHNCLEIGICHSHSGYIEIMGEPMPFQEGDVVIIPQNVPHTTYSSPGTESHWSYIYIDPQILFRGLLTPGWQNVDMTPSSYRDYKPILSRENYPHINQLVLDIIRELSEQKPSYQLSAKGLLLSLYVEIYRIEVLTKTADAAEATDDSGIAVEPSIQNTLAIAPVLEYIEGNYMQQFTISELADLCHWSPTHFRRVFHDIMGTSPLDFVNNTRINKACFQLRTTEDSVLNISENVGFHSVSSFNRYFSKKMQMSPRDYRKQMQKSDMHVESQAVREYTGWLYPEELSLSPKE